MSAINEAMPWLLSKVVLPQNTDHAGVMWHGSYFLWLEEARITALFDVGLEYKDLSNEGYEMPVVNLNVKYITPLFHGDKVVLESRIYQGRGVRLHWETRFVKDLNKIAALANVDLALVRKSGSRYRLLRNGPDYIEKALLKLQNGPSPENNEY